MRLMVCEMKEWFYLLLAYLIPIIGAIYASISNDVPLFLSCLAIGWCCKLEIDK